MTLACQARYALRLSRREFARLLGVSLRTVEAWEQRTREPTAAAATLLSLLVAEPVACQRALVALGLEPVRSRRIEAAWSALVREWIDIRTEDTTDDDESRDEDA